jgi:lysozyme
VSWIDPYIDKIKQFEGYSPRAAWDYKQNSNGYGTRALYPGEVIDKATADQRFNGEVGKAANLVDAFAPDAPPGVKAGLADLTYNAGTKWQAGGLGKAVLNKDYDTAAKLLPQYSHAGGQFLPSLYDRRNAEASWFKNSDPAPPAQVADSSVPPILQGGFGREENPAPSPTLASAAPSPILASAAPAPSSGGAFAGLGDKLGKLGTPSGMLSGIGSVASAFAGSSGGDDKAAQQQLAEGEKANAQALAQGDQEQKAALQMILQRKQKTPMAAFG